MYLKISEKAQERLEKYIQEGATIILDLDDGVGKYSKMGVCSLDTSFRLLLLASKQETSDYPMTMDCDLGAMDIQDYRREVSANALREIVLNLNPLVELWITKSL